MNSSMQLIKKVIPHSLRPILKRLVLKPINYDRVHKLWQKEDPLSWPLPGLVNRQGFEKYEYSVFSQNGEDGLLRYLYSEIGLCSRFFLEFGFGVKENNSLRLILKEHFGGVFIDGSESSVKQFSEAAQLFGISNVQTICEFLDLDNLEPTIIGGNVPKEIDLLSIDVDGNDYWFWEGITCISPRIVVIEYNASLGSELSLTVPYDPCFERHQKHKSGFYYGASIMALEKLGKRKGFTLIGCDSNGINAFFVRNDCLTQELKLLSQQSAYRPHKSRLNRGYSIEEQFKVIKDLPFISIE